MKTIVAVIIYNRINNLKKWINCWRQSYTEDAELIIIHNDNGESAKFKAICDAVNIRYIKRGNVGLDIGAFQDVVRERLQGFPNDWDYLLWCSDDCLPMSKDFIRPFINELDKPGVGLSCMQISKSNPGGVWHVRTTGYCITKEMSLQLVFPADPVTTKQHCYLFEHRGGNKTISEQIRGMGLSCNQVSKVKVSPLWDSLHPNLSLRLNRQDEFNKVWGIVAKVVFICTIFNTYPQVISSLLQQTHKNWELVLIHDGPSSNGMLSYIPKDDRIKYIETEKRRGYWGHYYRQWALQELRKGELSDAEYVVIGNADNYYAPAFVDSLLTGFKQPNAVASYCENMVHSYTKWGVLPVRFERGFMDSGGVMVKTEIACRVGWNDITTHSADWKYFRDIAAKYGKASFVSVPGCLFVHN